MKRWSCDKLIKHSYFDDYIAKQKENHDNVSNTLLMDSMSMKGGGLGNGLGLGLLGNGNNVGGGGTRDKSKVSQFLSFFQTKVKHSIRCMLLAASFIYQKPKHFTNFPFQIADFKYLTSSATKCSRIFQQITSTEQQQAQFPSDRTPSTNHLIGF